MPKLWGAAVSTVQLPNLSMNCLKRCVRIASGGERRISFHESCTLVALAECQMQTSVVRFTRTLVNFKSTLVCLPARNLDGEYPREHLSVCHSLPTRIRSDDVHHSDFRSTPLRLPDETLALPMSPQSKPKGVSKGFLSEMHLHDWQVPCSSKPVAKNTWLKLDILRISDPQRGMDSNTLNLPRWPRTHWGSEKCLSRLHVEPRIKGKGLAHMCACDLSNVSVCVCACVCVPMRVYLHVHRYACIYTVCTHIPLHYITLHCTILHYITLLCIALHWIALHCITLHTHVASTLVVPRLWDWDSRMGA